MRAGLRNTRIEFQRREVTQDPVYGTTVEGEWTTVARAWAQVQDVLPSRAENLADGVSIGRRPARIRLLYRRDITSDMRIKIGDRRLRIIAGPAEIGRHQGIEIMAEQLSTEGQEP